MIDKFEYIKEFINKHHYNSVVQLYPNTAVTMDDIEAVKFNEKDIPLDKKIPIQDIIYDILSDLPADVFFRYIEYLEKNKKSDVSYIYWMTKMSNHYQPINVDNSASYRMKDIIYNKINKLKNTNWF